jgi:hypothetical protein
MDIYDFDRISDDAFKNFSSEISPSIKAFNDIANELEAPSLDGCSVVLPVKEESQQCKNTLLVVENTGTKIGPTRQTGSSQVHKSEKVVNL